MNNLIIQTTTAFFVTAISDCLVDSPLDNEGAYTNTSIKDLLSQFFPPKAIEAIFKQIEQDEKTSFVSARFKLTVNKLSSDGHHSFIFSITPESPLLAQDSIEKDYLINVVRFSPGFMYLKDTNSVYVVCNENFAQAAGLKHPDDIVGKTDYDLAWGMTESDLFRKGDAEVLSGTPKINFEEPQLQADGKTRTVLANKVPLYDHAHRVIGVLGNYIDITDRKQAEEDLVEAKSKAEEANKAKTEFMRNMEHDIRTPFSGLLGVSDILCENETDPSKKQLLISMRQSAKELLDYLNGILDFSSIELGSLPVQAKKLDVKKLLERIVTIERPAALYKQLSLDMTIDKDLPNVLIGDPYRLERILINLVSNAIKFTPKGQVLLDAKLIEATKDRQAIVTFSVHDTGVGIPQDKINYIYEKFTRLTPSNQGTHRGTGMGLRIVKRFMDDLDGELEIQTQEQQGTTFYCTLTMKIPLRGELLDKRR